MYSLRKLSGRVMKRSAMQVFVGLSAIAQAGLAVLAVSGAVGAHPANSFSAQSRGSK